MKKKIKDTFLINNQTKTAFILTILCMVASMLIPNVDEKQFIKSFLRMGATIFILYYGIKLMPHKKRAFHIFFAIGICINIFGDLIYYRSIIGPIIGNLALMNAYFMFSIGFFTQLRVKILPFLSIIPISVVAYFFTTQILFDGLEKNSMGYYVFYVITHALILALFLWSALITLNQWIIIGASFFVLMDIVKSISFFVYPFILSTQIGLFFYVLGHLFLARSMPTNRRFATTVEQ